MAEQIIPIVDLKDKNEKTLFPTTSVKAIVDETWTDDIKNVENKFGDYYTKSQIDNMDFGSDELIQVNSPATDKTKLQIETSDEEVELATMDDIPDKVSDLVNDKGYVTSIDIANKQDKLTAGANITIDENNVISATGGGSGSDIGTIGANGGIAMGKNAQTSASGDYAFAEGTGTIANGSSQHVQGSYNIADTTSAHIVGAGTDDENRKNIHTVDKQGNAWYQGDVYIGSTSGTNKDEGSKRLATADDVREMLDVGDETFTVNVPTKLSELEIDIPIGGDSEELDVLYDFNKDKTYSVVSKSELGTNVPPTDAKYYSLVSADGDANQESTNGYQLLNPINYAPNEVVNGIEWVNNADGSVSTKNVASANSSHSLYLGTLPAGTYTLNSGTFNSTNTYLVCKINDSWSTISKTTFTLDADTLVRIQLVINAGYSYDDKIYPMLEKGTVAHDFEPYTGGIPSPNPEYPQPITDRIERMDFKITNRNLVKSFDYDFSLSGSGDNRTVVTSTITKEKSASIIKLKPLTDYCFSQSDITSGDVFARIALFNEMPKLGSISTRFFSINNIGEIAFKTSNSEIYAMIYITSEKDIIREFQLEYGTESTPYVPYEVIKEHSLTPPRPLAKVGEYKDRLTRDGWEYNTNYTIVDTITMRDSGSRSVSVSNLRTGTSRNTVISNKFIGSLTGNYGTCRINSSYVDIIFYGKPNEVVNDLIVIYPINNEIIPLSPEDKEFIDSLKNIPSDYVITITDQNGKDVSYMLEYMVDKKVVSDVQIDGQSIVEGGVASIPYASTDAAGVVKVNTSYGNTLTSAGYIRGAVSTQSQYASRHESLMLCKGTLENIKNDIVKRALVDNDITLTDEEKKSANDWLGVTELIESVLGGSVDELASIVGVE